MKYVVKTSIFEGPIAIMHEMIEKRSLSVSEFSIVDITEDFIEFVKSLEENEKSEIAHFISIASVLILLKSKSLLPESLFEEEENRSVEILENQLKAHGLMKETSKIIQKIFGKNILHLAKALKINASPVFIPDPQISFEYAQKYLEERINSLTPEKEGRKEIKVDKKIKIEDALSHVRNVIKKLKSISLKAMHDAGDDERLRDKNKKTVVILFLALLELVKLGEIDVVQENHFSDIIINESI